MKTILTILLSVVVLIPLFGLSAETKREDSRIEDFELVSNHGKLHKLSEFKDSKAIVVMFIATKCPWSNAYNERMAGLPGKYKAKNIAFVGINSNKAEKLKEIKKHTSENNFTFPVLKDYNNVVADMFGAERTPEVFVLNSDFEVLYHGRIDDSAKVDKVTSNDLENALSEILAGKQVSRSETKAFGCTIKRVKK